MINFIILTKTDSEEKYKMTNNLIQSIHNTIYPKNGSFSNYRILVIESIKTDFKYQEETLELVNNTFNYNYSLNRGIDYFISKYTQNDWFCFMNNDIICDSQWINKISKVYQKDNQIKSFSPDSGNLVNDYEYGYTLFKHLNGYCFITHKKALEKINNFDETFSFYFQDDDYLMQIKLNNIKHCCVKNSIVRHIGSCTHTESLERLLQDRDKFIVKYGKDAYINLEIQKKRYIIKKNEKIGIGIITYNRPKQFNNLMNSIKDIDYINHIIIIKDKNINYGKNSPNKFINERIKYINLTDSKCIAENKNVALKYLIDNGCTHLFIIEDDVIIKNPDVFLKYIETAKIFRIEHLNFCRRYLPKSETYQKPIYKFTFLNTGLEFYHNLCGIFSYFTKNAIETAGYMNENYINALEHCEHTYRLCLNNMYTPKFHMFADIMNSNEYLEDGGKKTSICESDIQKQNVYNAFTLFKNTYNKKMSQLECPTLEDLKDFYIKKMSNR